MQLLSEETLGDVLLWERSICWGYLTQRWETQQMLRLDKTVDPSVDGDSLQYSLQLKLNNYTWNLQHDSRGQDGLHRSSASITPDSGIFEAMVLKTGAKTGHRPRWASERVLQDCSESNQTCSDVCWRTTGEKQVILLCDPTLHMTHWQWMDIKKLPSVPSCNILKNAAVFTQKRRIQGSSCPLRSLC